MGLDDVVHGYATLASSMLERWNTLFSNAAAKVDAGEYDGASWASDLTAGATLATQGGLLWAAETVEAMANLCEAGPSVAASGPFRAPAGATLELAGPLVKGEGLDQLPVDVVSVNPRQLGSNETEFTLRADATGYRGATYVGTVNATTDAGTTAVIVWLVVP
jgi:hypothetical protein